jgi:hypothetical protein
LGVPRKSGVIGTEWGTQLLVYADAVNLLGENINIKTLVRRLV